MFDEINESLLIWFFFSLYKPKTNQIEKKHVRLERKTLLIHHGEQISSMVDGIKFKKAYKLHDKIIRLGQVIVATTPKDMN